jgi:hypothetical protein
VGRYWSPRRSCGSLRMIRPVKDWEVIAPERMFSSTSSASGVSL